jgi:hypothetical protein
MKFRGPSYVVRMEDVRKTYKILVWEPPVKWSFEEPRVLENRIKLNLNETACDDVGLDWLRSSPMVKYGISNIRETNRETVSQSYVSVCQIYRKMPWMSVSAYHWRSEHYWTTQQNTNKHNYVYGYLMLPTLECLMITFIDSKLLGSTDHQHVKNTYVLLVQGQYSSPSRPSNNLGNNLHCVFGYRSRHSNSVCPGWVRSSHLADRGSTCRPEFHSTDPAGLNSRALRLLPSATAVLQSWLSSTVHSTFCEYNTRN